MRDGECLKEKFAKISLPLAAAAFRNEEQRERGTTVTEVEGRNGHGVYEQKGTAAEGDARKEVTKVEEEA